MYTTLMYHINYWAVIVASVIYFIIGSFWFSPALFGSTWRKELSLHNVAVPEQAAQRMLLCMGVTFISCILAALGLAWIIKVIGITTAFSALMLGSIISTFFVIPSVATIFVWENRSMTLFLIDIGYPVCGIIVSAIILTLWQ